MAYNGKGKGKTNPDRIGALWLNESEAGNKYLSGQIEIDGEIVKINVIKNGYKEEDKHPDYVIFKSTPKGARKQKDQDDVPF